LRGKALFVKGKTMTRSAAVLLSITIAFASCKADVLPISDTATSTAPVAEVILPNVDIEKTRLKATEAREFCASKKFNLKRCILVDMSLLSGVERFFVWDFDRDTIAYSCLVSHGCCDNPWGEDASKNTPTFSNTSGSHCSSLGKYRIGERGYSNWGINIKYLLHGLDSTNSNALARTIVFHSWELVGDEEPYPNGTAEGWGCPAVSNQSMTTIDPLLKSSDKPLLMWIYL